MSDGHITVAQCVEGLPLGRCVWEALVCAWLAWFLLGALNECTPFAFSFLSTEWAATEQNVMALSAALALGNFMAIAAGGWAADRHGRLAVIRPALVLTAASGMLLHTAQNFSQALVARFVLGLVSGGLLSVVPALLAELLPSKHRGFYLTVWCSGWPAGALFSVCVGCLVPGVSWRAFYTIMLAPALLLYICTKAEMLPESPRYLYLAGRREEGYNTLMDMYEKEQLPIPWAPETIAVTCAPPRPQTDDTKSDARTAITLWLAFAMFCASAAAQSMKLWMPTMLVAQAEDDAAGMPISPNIVDMSAISVARLAAAGFAQGPRAVGLLSLSRAPLMLDRPNYAVMSILSQSYLVEMLGVIACAYLSTILNRRRMVKWSLLAAAFLTIATLAVATGGRRFASFVGPVLGAQLAAQSAALNFLQVFVCEHFPTSRRAKTTAFVIFASQVGNFTIPVIGGLVVHRFSPALAVVFFSMLYLVSWLVSFRLPIPTHSERTIHDVDEPEACRDSGARVRKRDWASYQAI